MGSYVLVMGFVLTHDEANALIKADSRNSDVLFPFLIGDDLNSNHDQAASRDVIFFSDWSMSKAQTYPLCFEIVEKKVKP